MTRSVLSTAGETLTVESALPWVAELAAEGAGGELRPAGDATGSVAIVVEADRRAFDVRGWEPLTRGAWRRADDVVMENVCTTGFDLHVACTLERATFTYRWRPPARERAAARALRSRFHLLARAVLLQYPALWWAGTRGRAPLHASACSTNGRTVLLTAPGGVGRSTLTLRELEAGGSATGDNLAVGDGTTVWGLVEPLRVEGAAGRRMPHGRNETVLPRRAEFLVPDSLVMLRRGAPGDAPRLEPVDAATAARSVVTSTYMAGELRRYWAFAGTLSAGTDAGPAQAPVEDVASAFASALPRFVLISGRPPTEPASELLRTLEEVPA